ncbi:MAG: beta-ketoacyl synthase N-terminal-like domain-containing protein [Candidatus Binatia bacterium]
MRRSPLVDEVLITGIGVVSPLGHSAGELTRRLAAGERAASDADGVQIADIPVGVLPASVRARIGRLDRICRLALAAAYLAIDDARLPLPLAAPERVGLSIGTGLGCLLSDAEFYAKVAAHGAPAASPRVFAYTVSSAAAGEISIALGLHGPNTVSHMGLAAGAGAIGYAAALLRLGKADVVLAGGADAHGPALAEALRGMGLLKRADAARPFRDAVPGVWPSEGALFAVLERGESAAARGARAYARLAGYAAGFAPDLAGGSADAVGIGAVLRRALDGAGAGAPGLVLASAHGTPVDAVEREALRAALGDGATPITAPKAALGETFGASAALALGFAAGLLNAPQPFADGVAIDLAGAPGALRENPDSALISALCYSGSAAALVISASTQRREDAKL